LLSLEFDRKSLKTRSIEDFGGALYSAYFRPGDAEG